MNFPVKVPYTVSADITKYIGEIFNPIPSLEYISQKKKEITLYGDKLSHTQQDAYDHVRELSIYCGFNETEKIEEIAFQLEEDIAILHRGVLKAICFCFPSGFVPASKIGMNFFDMHLPVADGDRLRAASTKVTELISKEGASFRRYVWTVSSLSSLSQLPFYARPEALELSDLYFRTETQTTIGHTNDICFFFVKVNMTPLATIWDDTEKRKMIIDSVNSMSDQVLTYKNLHEIKLILNHNV
jgi:hypothetical protein